MSFVNVIWANKVLSAGILLGVVIIAALLVLRSKQVAPVGWGWFGTVQNNRGVALGGYDAVSYFTPDGPQSGLTEHILTWNAAEWRFSTAANLEAFRAAPERYAPQVGGFCGFAVSKGFTARPDPSAWHILDDQLFLFADQNFRDKWIAALPDGILDVTRSSWARR